MHSDHNVDDIRNRSRATRRRNMKEMNDEGERGLFAYYKISPKEQRTEYRFFCFQPLANERRFFVKLNNEVLFWRGGGQNVSASLKNFPPPSTCGRKFPRPVACANDFIFTRFLLYKLWNNPLSLLQDTFCEDA